MSFTDRKPRTATAAEVEVHARVDRSHRKFNGRPHPWGCLLCGHIFVEGDTYRWVYANFGTSAWRRGNFFVCENCDEGDEACIEAAARILDGINPVMRSRI